MCYSEWPTMILVNALVLCLASDDCRNVWLEKRESHPQMLLQSSKEDFINGILNDQPPSPSPSLYLGPPVIMNIRIIDASTGVQIEDTLRFLEIHLEKIILDSPSISTPRLRKVKMNIWKKEKKKKKNAYSVNHTTKNILYK